MIIVNWLPEIFLICLLFVVLMVTTFRMWSYRSLSLCIGIASVAELIYLLARQDLAFFDSPLKILYSDSLSYFGKVMSLLCLVVFSLGIHFHRGLNFRSKQNANLFLIFYSIFLMGMFEANNLVLFLGSAIGIYVCSTTLILIESGQSQSWVRIFRQRALLFSVWMVVLALLSIYGMSLFGSVYLSDWIQAFSKGSASQVELFVFSFLILLASAIPLRELMHVGNAPFGLSVFCYGLFLLLSVFWMRLGVPFFHLSGFLPKTVAQILIAMMFGIFSLHYAIQTVRTREHHRWYASALPTVVGLSLFLVLLSGEHTLPEFYSISIAMLFTFGLVSHAFLDQEYRHKTLLVLSMLSLMGAPPLILGEQFYRLIHDAVSTGNLMAGILMFASWLILSVAITQMIGKVLLVRVAIAARRKFLFSEWFFLGMYLLCVISLTAFRPQVVSLLNDHPVLNLW